MYDAFELHVAENREARCERTSSNASLGEVTVGLGDGIDDRALADKLEEIEMKLAPMMEKRTGKKREAPEEEEVEEEGVGLMERIEV